MTIKVPEQYKCKKSGEIMVYPTTTPCGHNFEMGLIVRLMDDKPPAEWNCPCCQAPLGTNRPKINEPLRQEILAFNKRKTTLVVVDSKPQPKPVAEEVGVLITSEVLEKKPAVVLFGAASLLVSANIGNQDFRGASVAVQQDLNRALDQVSRTLSRFGQ